MNAIDYESCCSCVTLKSARVSCRPLSQSIISWQSVDRENILHIYSPSLSWQSWQCHRPLTACAFHFDRAALSVKQEQRAEYATKQPEPKREREDLDAFTFSALAILFHRTRELIVERSKLS